MASIRVLEPPAVEPVTLHEAKLHLRVDTDDEDVLIAALVRTARTRCEQHTRRAFVQQAIRATFDPDETREWGGGPSLERGRGASWSRFELPRPPFVELRAVTVHPEAGSPRPVPERDQRLALGGDEPAELEVRGFTSGMLQADYLAGYGRRGIDVPEPIRVAILQLVGAMFEEREGQVEKAPADVAPQLPPLVAQLLAPFRVIYL